MHRPAPRGFVRTFPPKTTQLRKPNTSLSKPSFKTVSQVSNKIAGNEEGWESVKRWLSRPSFLLLCGPTGIGKTFGIHTIADQYGYNVYEVNAGNCSSSILSDLYEVCGRETEKKTLVLLDEVDVYPDFVLKELSKFLKDPPAPCCPIAMTSSNNYNKEMETIKKKCDIVQMSGVRERTMLEYASKHFPKKLPKSIEKAATHAKGDMRKFIMRVKHPWCMQTDVFHNLVENVCFILSQEKKTCLSNEEADFVMSLLFCNYTSATESCDRVAEASETYSETDTMRTGNTRKMLNQAVHLLERQKVGKIAFRNVQFPRAAGVGDFGFDTFSCLSSKDFDIPKQYAGTQNKRSP